MSLTRNQWLDMWSSIKCIEFNAREIKSISHFQAPSSKGQLKGLAFGIQQEVDRIKHQIESVIGQME